MLLKLRLTRRPASVGEDFIPSRRYIQKYIQFKAAFNRSVALLRPQSTDVPVADTGYHADGKSY